MTTSKSTRSDGRISISDDRLPGTRKQQQQQQQHYQGRTSSEGHHSRVTLSTFSPAFLLLSLFGFLLVCSSSSSNKLFVRSFQVLPQPLCTYPSYSIQQARRGEEGRSANRCKGKRGSNHYHPPSLRLQRNNDIILEHRNDDDRGDRRIGERLSLLLRSRDNTALRSTTATATVDETVSTSSSSQLPEIGRDGIYHLTTPEQHRTLLAEFGQDHLIVVKFFAPWCKACKSVEPKYKAIAKDDKYASLPMIWAEFSVANNKEFVKDVGVVALPTIHLYAHQQLQEAFPCGPSKIAILKRKLVQFINTHIDSKTMQVKTSSATTTTTAAAAAVVDAEATKTKAAKGATIAVDTMSSTATVGADDTVASKASVSVQDESRPATQHAVLGNTTSRSSQTTYINSTMTDRRPTSTTVPTKDDDDDATTIPVIKSTEGRSTGGMVVVSQQTLDHLRTKVPFFADFTDDEFQQLMSKAQYQEFHAGDVIMREGKDGHTFYVMEEGEVEICSRTVAFSNDPLTTPASYLGTVLNRLGPGDWFGERALITGEPRAASIRATLSPTRCFAFDQADIPASSVLSGQRQASAKRMDQINGKYALDVQDLDLLEMTQQLEQSKLGSQIRGSANTPEVIIGVDTDDDVVLEQPPMEDVAPPTPETTSPTVKNNEMIFSLLYRLRLVRNAARCFDYLMAQPPDNVGIGNPGVMRRRSMLVEKLTSAQRDEFMQTFRIMDTSGDSLISLLELKRAIQTTSGDPSSDDSSISYSDDDLRSMITKSHANMDGREVLTMDDFLGIMAEAEFYYLFRDTFKSLDPDDTGFVRASDLDRILCGMRDLISNDRFSIIDVEDTDMMIDYEQFSRMLLGI